MFYGSITFTNIVLNTELVLCVRDSSGYPAAQRGVKADSPTRGTRGTPIKTFLFNIFAAYIQVWRANGLLKKRVI